MKTTLKLSFFLLLALSIWACTNKKESSKPEVEQRKTVEMVTDRGTMRIELYNETPLHRDNFLKLVKENAFDSLLFHRVIEDFMIQGGDPDSKNAQAGDTLGNGGLPYTVDAEFLPQLFHKKGVIGAAREDNLDRASSSMQFYIVQGKVRNDSVLDISEGRINNFLAKHYFNNDPINKPLLDSLQKARTDKNLELSELLTDSIANLLESYKDFQRYTIPENHRDVYKTIGGTPHLDQNYTVFGEVIQGLDVIDSIAVVKTDSLDRPIIDVRIRSVKVLE